jgi:hypothetical protein
MRAEFKELAHDFTQKNGIPHPFKNGSSRGWMIYGIY